jgi:hypothetical protein
MCRKIAAITNSFDIKFTLVINLLFHKVKKNVTKDDRS